MVRNTYEVQNVGDLLREKRRQLGKDIKEVSEHTKIRTEYLLALETGSYDKFASDVYAKGFLKKYAKYLGISPERAAAMYRRENSNKSNGAIMETNYLSSGLSNSTQGVFSAARVFTVLVLVVLVGFVFYLVSQVGTVLREPDLAVTAPVAAAVGETQTYTTTRDSVTIAGNVELGTVLTLNGSQVNVNNLQIFEVEDLPLLEGENQFVLEARTQFGQTSTVNLIVIRQIAEPATDIGNVNDIDSDTDLDTDTDPDADPNSSSEDATLTEVVAVVTVQGRDAYIQVRTDGNINFAQVVADGDGREFTASESVAISTPRPDAVKVQIGEEIYEITSTSEHVFRLENGQISVSVTE